MATPRLGSMSIEALLQMREQIDSTLSNRVAGLRKQLASIDGVAPQASGKRRGSKAKAKYRDPKTGQTWSGRGAPARWITAYEKDGRKREDFLISKPEDAPKRGAKKRAAKKGRRKK